MTVWRVEKYARSILEFRFGLERAARKLLAAWISCSCLDGGLELVMLWCVLMVSVKKTGMGENECHGAETQKEGTKPVVEGKSEGGKVGRERVLLGYPVLYDRSKSVNSELDNTPSLGHSNKP